MSLFGRWFGRSVEVDFTGFTDWHSHILPGVDDGVETLEDSLAILAEYEEMGFREVWLTPHVMEDVPNRPGVLLGKFDQLVDAYSGPVMLRLAAENMADALFDARIADNEFLPIGREGEMLLVETSCFCPPMSFDRTIAEIREAGYQPLVAHPERYAYVESIAEFERWREMGCRFQLNLLSLAGFYGGRAREFSRTMLCRRMYDCVGTDVHRLAQVKELRRMRLPVGLAERLQALCYA